MPEHEPGHPDELQQQLAKWLTEAMSPIGALPEGMTATEWAARNFIDSWRKPVRVGIDSIENRTECNTLRVASGVESIRSVFLGPEGFGVAVGKEGGGGGLGCAVAMEAEDGGGAGVGALAHAGVDHEDEAVEFAEEGVFGAGGVVGEFHFAWLVAEDEMVSAES